MEILKDFGVKPLLLLAQIVNFIILLLLLRRFLYRPILKILAERKKRIETAIKQAETTQKRFDEALKKEEEMLDNARKEALNIIDQAKEEAKAIQVQIQKETRDSIEATIKRTEAALTLEKQKMVAETKKQIVELVATAVEKVLAKGLEDREKERLVQQAIKEIQ